MTGVALGPRTVQRHGEKHDEQDGGSRHLKTEIHE